MWQMEMSFIHHLQAVAADPGVGRVLALLALELHGESNRHEVGLSHVELLVRADAEDGGVQDLLEEVDVVHVAVVDGVRSHALRVEEDVAHEKLAVAVRKDRRLLPVVHGDLHLHSPVLLPPLLLLLGRQLLELGDAVAVLHL